VHVSIYGWFWFGQVASLHVQIQKKMKSKRDQTLVEEAKGQSFANIRMAPGQMKMRRTLKGHFGKVTAMHWGGDGKLLISASQDGNLLVWNAALNQKLQVITLKSSYVMACGIESVNGNLIACGGLDNLCTVYRRDNPNQPIEMADHDGFISCCRFLSEKEVLSSSGDSTIIRWDINRAQPVNTFAEHSADVMYVAIRPNDKNVFASCSVDKTCKLWDIRTSPKAAIQTFFSSHLGDINAIDFMPSEGNVFATASQDNTVKLFDIRAMNELNSYGQVTAPSTAAGAADGAVPADGYTSVACSKSGRLIFAGHMNGIVHAYDTISAKNTPVYTLNNAHDRAVSDIGVSPSGDALCSAGWDGLLKVWA
jgi:guanine nucleotide-binding protein G(I)/G(S)/G(T) subunit beta-1